MDISGTALVVGGGSGIGRACAILLAKEGARGLIVADLALDAANDTIAECRAVATAPATATAAEESSSSSSFQAKAVYVDVTREESVRRLFEEVVKMFGRVDYVVNSAGIGVRQASDIATLSLSEFQRFQDINSTGTFLVTKHASIAMRAQDARPISPANPARGLTRGAIVNLGSASSLVASPGVLAYTAAKHAALGVTKNSALDNAPHLIRVNCVCPSWTDTPMVRRAIADVSGLAQFIEGAVPMGRIAVVDEVADVVLFLCSGRSSYVTGAALIVDGGTTLMAKG